MNSLIDLHTRTVIMLRAWADSAKSERGDVPGWVLVTMMTALLVIGLLAVAGDALARTFQRAMDAVSP